jgi:hypothetical protein
MCFSLFQIFCLHIYVLNLLVFFFLNLSLGEVSDRKFIWIERKITDSPVSEDLKFDHQIVL